MATHSDDETSIHAHQERYFPYPRETHTIYPSTSSEAPPRRPSRIHGQTSKVPAVESDDRHYVRGGPERLSSNRRHQRSIGRRDSGRRKASREAEETQVDVLDEFFGEVPSGPPPSYSDEDEEGDEEIADVEHADHLHAPGISQKIHGRPTRISQTPTARPRRHNRYTNKEENKKIRCMIDKYWSRASPSSFRDVKTITIRATVFVDRRGKRFISDRFQYTKGHWTDGRLAQKITEEYRNAKNNDADFLRKIFAYKTIAYIRVFKISWVVDPENRDDGRWETELFPITERGDRHGKDAFMYRMRNIKRYGNRRLWCKTIDNCIKRDTFVELQLIEAFNSTVVLWGLLIAVLLTLAVALVYGFLRNNDFATGFSIASWMVTAVGFLAAVIAAGEYFGLESFDSFTAVSEEEDFARSNALGSRFQANPHGR